MSWFERFFSKKNKQKEVPEIPDEMKYLIVGLGNIGAEYHKTRHNIGFDILDVLAEEFEVPFKTDKLGDVAEIKYKGRALTLLKPSTYMNLSGKAVNYWLQKKKIPKENLLILVDDLNLPYEKIRLRGKGSDGGHNGLKNINEIIGSKYARLRFGIGDEFSKGRQINFVLGKWNEAEQEKMPDLIKKSNDMIKAFSAIGLARTMNQFN
ncbi:MAG: aminoacyl-tRNA hydrolase [Saprospiraceae bacterium]